MSGARSQRKGKRGRREVMDLLEKHGFTPVPTIDGITTDDLRVRELPKPSFEGKGLARLAAPVAGPGRTWTRHVLRQKMTERSLSL